MPERLKKLDFSKGKTCQEAMSFSPERAREARAKKMARATQSSQECNKFSVSRIVAKPEQLRPRLRHPLLPCPATLPAKHFSVSKYLSKEILDMTTEKAEATSFSEAP
jgi:hypothetical protein